MTSPAKGKKLTVPKKSKKLARKKSVPAGTAGAAPKVSAKPLPVAAASVPPPAKPAPVVSPAPVPSPVEPKKEGQTTQQVQQAVAQAPGRPIPQATVAPPVPVAQEPQVSKPVSAPPRHIGSLREPTRQQPASTRSEAEDLQEQVALYWEVCDSLLGGARLESIADLLHLLVTSLNLDVVSLVMLDPDNPDKLEVVASRGYKDPPQPAVADCWGNALDKGALDWAKLMKLAENKDNDVSYWIVVEGLHSVGYVPIRDSSKIHGFLFVGAHDKEQKPSPLASNLLDACGSRIGLARAESLVVKSGRRANGGTSVAGGDIAEQLASLKRALEDLKRLDAKFQKDLASVAYECDTAVVNMEQSIKRERG